MAHRLKITRGGQISMPAEVRRRWESSYVTAEDHGDHLVVRPAPEDPLDAVFGVFAEDARGEPSLAEIRADERAAEAEGAERRRGRS